MTGKDVIRGDDRCTTSTVQRRGRRLELSQTPGSPYLVQFGQRLARMILGADLALADAAQIMGMTRAELDAALVGDYELDIEQTLRLTAAVCQVEWVEGSGQYADPAAVSWWLACGTVFGMPQPTDDKLRRFCTYASVRQIVVHVRALPDVPRERQH